MKKLIAGIVALMCSGALLAQVNLELQTKKPFYINANSALNSQIYDIQDGFLSIEYLDNIGKAKEIILKIYDWKMQALGNYALDKSLGLNHYSFDLADAA